MKLWTPPGADTRSARQRADEEHLQACRLEIVRKLNRSRTLLMRAERKPLNSNGRKRDVDSARTLAVQAEQLCKEVHTPIYKLENAPELLAALKVAR